jgi:ribonuclease P protein component
LSHIALIKRSRAYTVLRGPAQFEAVLRARSRIATRNFVVLALPNAQGYARLGIIAGRKAAPRAVDRNRGKRLIREVFRRTAFGPHDIAVQLRNDLRAHDNDTLRAELLRLMETAVRKCGLEPASQDHRQ